MKKIILGMVTVGVMAMGGGLPCLENQEFDKKFPEYRAERETRVKAMSENREIIEAGWGNNCLGGNHKETTIPLGVAKAHYGLPTEYKANGKIQRYIYKVILTQKIPCLIVLNRTNNKTATSIKLGNNSAVLTNSYPPHNILLLSTYGRVGEDFKYNPINQKRFRQVLGKSLSCVNKENEETWEIYRKKTGEEWKFFDKVHFTYTKKHRILKRLGIR